MMIVIQCVSIVGTKAHHFLSDQDKRVVRISMNCILTSAQNHVTVLSLGIDIGSRVTAKFQKQQVSRYVQTLDNRAACAVLLNLAEYLSRNKPSIRVSLAFTFKEFNGESLPVQQRLVLILWWRRRIGGL